MTPAFELRIENVLAFDPEARRKEEFHKDTLKHKDHNYARLCGILEIHLEDAKRLVRDLSVELRLADDERTIPE